MIALRHRVILTEVRPAISQRRMPPGRARVGARHAWWITVLVFLLWIPTVFAHAGFTGSNPRSGSVLSGVPSTITLSFSEPVTPLVLKLIQPGGTVIELATDGTPAAYLDIPLPVLQQQGTYGVSWRVVSLDGHPIGGTMTFAVGSHSSEPTRNVQTHGVRAPLIWLLRSLAYVGLFFGVGYAVWRPGPRDVNAKPYCHHVGALSIAAVAIILGLGLTGLDALDRPLIAIFSSGPWVVAATSTAGHSAALALTALICSVVSCRATAGVLRPMTAMFALGLLGGTFCASGHASTANPAWLSRLALWVHSVTVCLWIGALLPLAAALQMSNARALLRRFSHWIPAILCGVLVSGSILAYLQIDSASSLWETPYGQILSLKLIMVLALLGLGAYNRFRLTPAVLHVRPAASMLLRRVILLECAIAVGIFATVGLWRFTPPPRTLGDDAAITQPVTGKAQGEGATANFVLLPSSSGRLVTLELTLSKTDRSPLNAVAVNVHFSNPEFGIEPLEYSAEQGADGKWRVTDIELPALTRWKMRIDVYVSDFDLLRFDTTLDMEK